MDRTDAAKESGIVTVEAAIGITVLIALLAMIVGAVSIVRIQADICHAVREAARAEAIGDSGQRAANIVLSRPVAISVEPAGEWLRVSASSPAVSLGGISLGALTCTVHTYLEPVAQ